MFNCFWCDISCIAITILITVIIRH
jgi:hypothetical protein